MMNLVGYSDDEGSSSDGVSAVDSKPTEKLITKKAEIKLPSFTALLKSTEPLQTGSPLKRKVGSISTDTTTTISKTGLIPPQLQGRVNVSTEDRSAWNTAENS